MFTHNPYYNIDVAKAVRAEDICRAQESATVKEARQVPPETTHQPRRWFAGVRHHKFAVR